MRFVRPSHVLGAARCDRLCHVPSTRLQHAVCRCLLQHFRLWLHAGMHLDMWHLKVAGASRGLSSAWPGSANPADILAALMPWQGPGRLLGISLVALWSAAYPPTKCFTWTPQGQTDLALQLHPARHPSTLLVLSPWASEASEVALATHVGTSIAS